MQRSGKGERGRIIGEIACGRSLLLTGLSLTDPSHKKLQVTSYKLRAGFTLIEVLVVVGIFAILAALGLFLSMDVYRGNSFRSERNMVVSILQKVRSRAVNNINQTKHGVRFESDRYVIFEGPICAAAGEEIPKSSAIANSGGCVVFDQLTGDRDTVNSTINSLNLTGQGFSSTVTINDRGRISW